MSKRIASMIFCLLLAVAAGCHAKKSQDADSIAYAGAAVITENVFPQFLPMFVEKTGIKMAAIKTVGSQEAVKYVMDGRADVGGVAHKLTADELALKPYVQTIGFDAVTVVVNTENPITKLTRAQLKGIYTGQITNWKELGWKDLPIHTVSMTVKGKFGIVKVFQDAVLEGAPYGSMAEETDFLYRVAPAVEEKANAIGVTSYAYQVPRARTLAVDGIEANPANLRSKTYPLAREMYLISREEPTGKVKQFFDLLLSPEGQAIVSKKFASAK